MKAPFPYFGGKRKVAPEVWAALGDVDNYVEPFAGSLAVLLERPAWHNGSTETVNDKDQYLGNFWRALSYAPDEVARYADWPVNECVPAGTLISTPNGDIPVEDIRPGMSVWGEQDGNIVPTLVLATKRSMAREFVKVGNLLLTGNHPVWTKERNYVDAGQLTDGLHVAIIDCPINGVDLPVLYLEHEPTPVGNLRIKRSENGCSEVCRCDISGAPPIQRASFSRYARRENLSGLLDSFAGQCGGAACVSGNRARGRRWLAGQGKILDRPLSSRRKTDEFNRRRGWNTRVTAIREVSHGGIVSAQGDSLPSWPRFSNEGQESHTGGYREDSRRRDWAQALRFSQSKAIACEKRKEASGYNGCGISSTTQGQTVDGSAQAKDCSYNYQPQSGSGNRDRTGIRIRYCRIEGIDGKRSISESGNPQGLSLQRESSPFPVAVYNFETATHNYFANRILVHNCDLFARHLWLVNEGKTRLRAGMDADPEWYDAKIAGWWLWGICQWIGSGWCSGGGPYTYATLAVDGDAGQGVNRQLVHLGNAGQGVNRQLVHLGDAGQGVNRKLVHLGDAGQGDGFIPRNGALFGYMRQLAERLRYVRVCCGDWQRVVTTGALSYGATVGVFLDPPYSDAAGRDMTLYSEESGTVANDVRGWCIANGDNPRYRIVLAGYEDEHAAHMPSNWRMVAWKANASFQTARAAGRNQDNRHKERLWLSPHCLRPQLALFAE